MQPMGKKQILVVDDELDIVEIICEILQGAGYETFSATDGQQALEAMAHRKPDLVVLDIKMPVLDGISVIQQMRNDPSLAKVPVVVVTATQFLIGFQDQHRALAISGCVAKPFEPEEILSAVGKALERTVAHG